MASTWTSPLVIKEINRILEMAAAGQHPLSMPSRLTAAFRVRSVAATITDRPHGARRPGRTGGRCAGARLGLSLELGQEGTGVAGAERSSGAVGARPA